LCPIFGWFLRPWGMMLQALILILGVCLFAIVAYYDIRTLAGNPIAGLYTLAASAALFIATFLLFWRGLLGGGDVKLIGATGLLVGYHDLFEFLFVMSVSGGLIAVAIRARDRLGARGPTLASLEHQKRPALLTVPYGAAIAAAGIVSLLLQNFRPD